MLTSPLRSRLVLLALVVLGLAVGPASAGASVGQVRGNLNISPYDSYRHSVHVFGYIPMTRTEAQGFVDSGAYVAITLWGDDVGPDDLVDLMIGERWWASDRGLEFDVRRPVRDSKLNEDWGLDELYANICLCHSGTAIRKGQTLRWNDYF